MVSDFVAGDADILVRAFRGEDVERTPVWLMRQVQQFALSLMQISQTSQFVSGTLWSVLQDVNPHHYLFDQLH
jgi:LAS superfamily LD-carboxypeptidase LdcB